MHVEASSPGELVAVNMYGSLPNDPGGTMTLLVALDILPDFVITVGLKDIKAGAFISATKEMIKKFSQMNIV